MTKFFEPLDILLKAFAVIFYSLVVVAFILGAWGLFMIFKRVFHWGQGKPGGTVPPSAAGLVASGAVVDANGNLVPVSS